MSQQFSFTKLVVADLEAMHEFYTTVFGLRELARVDAAIGDRPIHEIMYLPTSEGGGSLVLFHFEGQDTPVNEESILGFVSDDLDALVATAVANGGRVVEEPHEMTEHGIRVGFVTDPEGHLLELVEMLPPQG
ncbi:MAG: VOC family protein [Acidimicrobiales bacterium]|nr:VOC family protein [Acidimicrobiales bacterium]